MTVEPEIGMTEQEANSRAIEELKSVLWASALLEAVQELKAPASFLFELRFAAEIHRAGFAAAYEYKTGVGLTSVDFRLDCTPDWLIELLSPKQHSRGDEQSQMHKFAGVLSDKAYSDNGLPSKIPVPMLGRYHLVIVDVRDYLYGMGDVLDWRQIAYGADGVKGPNDWALHWLPKEVKGQPGPICGVFDPRSPVESAKVFQERVHFIGFINERSYLPGEMRTVKAAHYLPNPNLFRSDAEARTAFQTYPFRPQQKADLKNT
jgi:hypothetical protein